jgi:hypothetical protein
MVCTILYPSVWDNVVYKLFLGFLLSFATIIISKYSSPVWNQYFCTDVKVGLLQTKFNVKYKPLWIDVYDIYWEYGGQTSSPIDVYDIY